MSFSALDAVYASIDELNEQADRLVPISKNIDTPLFGAAGIDSLDLVNLIVGIEQYVEDETDNIIVVVNESFISNSNNALKTIGDLANHVENVISNSN